MEPNLPVTAKKIWSIVRVFLFMLRKGISKRSKFILDLNMMIKRSKIAGKALHNLMFHHHQPDRHLSFDARPGEYEFSCSNSPAYPISLFPFHLNKNRKHNGGNNSHNSHFFSCTHAPATDDDAVTVNAVMKAMEMLHSGATSPALPGFGRVPMVRQLRISDSPFPLRDVDMEDSHVDEAAEEFILKFYKELKKQNIVALS